MMNLTDYSLANRKVIRFFLLLLLAAGALCLVLLDRREDAAGRVDRSLSVVCLYPGATPAEVELSVTEPLERSIQSLPRVAKIVSESRFGVARIVVDFDPTLAPDRMGQLRDELRGKLLDVRDELPPEALPPRMDDDYHEQYDLYYGVWADEGFEWSELREAAQLLKRKMLTVAGVRKVALFGEQTPVIEVSVSASALANFSIRPDQIIQTVRQQSTVMSGGEVPAGDMTVHIAGQSLYRGTADIRDQLLINSENRQFRLGDIAHVQRGYSRPPRTLMRVDGRRAIGLGAAFEARADAVQIARRIERMLIRERSRMAVGMDWTLLYSESRNARQQTASLLLRLALSVLLVAGTVLLAIGVRTGVALLGSQVLAFAGMLLLMRLAGAGLSRMSLAGFLPVVPLIAGALVAAATSGGTAGGCDGEEQRAMRRALTGAAWIVAFGLLPLLAAASPAIEPMKPLALTALAALLTCTLLRSTQMPLAVAQGAGFRLSPRMERFGARVERMGVGRRSGGRRALAVACLVTLAAAGIGYAVGFGQLPDSGSRYLRAEVFLPDGFDIRATESNLARLEQWLLEQPTVCNVSVTAGATPLRYYRTGLIRTMQPNYGTLLVETDGKRSADAIESGMLEFASRHLPDVRLRRLPFSISPLPEATLEYGFVGERIDTLLRLSTEAQRRLCGSRMAVDVRNGWGNRVPQWMPLYSQMKGQRIGVSRSRMMNSIGLAAEGYPIGLYREGDLLLPILLLDERIDDYNLTNLQSLPVFSARGRVYSLEQAIDGARLEFAGSVIRRLDRERMMSVLAEPAPGYRLDRTETALRDSMRTIDLPEGYAMRELGERKMRLDAAKALARRLPLAGVLVVSAMVLLFRSFRRTATAVLLLLPTFAGALAGAMLTGRVLDPTLLPALCASAGMGVFGYAWLLACMDALQRRGMARDEALRTAVRRTAFPVGVVCAATTAGMLPQLFDPLFGEMAAAIAGGAIAFALLYVWLLPTLHALLARR